MFDIASRLLKVAAYGLAGCVVAVVLARQAVNDGCVRRWLFGDGDSAGHAVWWYFGKEASSIVRTASSIVLSSLCVSVASFLSSLVSLDLMSGNGEYSVVLTSICAV